MPLSRNRADLIWLVAIPLLLIAFALRLYRVDTTNLWIDELFMWHYVKGWPDPAAVGARYYVYLTFVNFSAQLIPGELGLRWPSVMSGMLSIAVGYQVGRQFRRWQMGVIAAALLAVLPIGISFAQQALSYGLVILGGVISLALIPLIERPHLRWARVAYLVCIGLTSAIHLLAAPWFGVQIGMLILRRLISKRGAPYWLHGMALMSVAAGVALVQAIGYFGSYARAEGLGWIQAPDIFGESIKFLSAGSGLGTGSQGAGAALIAGVGVLLALIVAAGALLVRNEKINKGWSGAWTLVLFGALTVVVPAMLFAVSYLYRPLWGIRFVLPSVFSFVFLMALAFDSQQPKRLGWALAVMLVGFAAFTSIRVAIEKAANSEDWRGAAAYISEHAGEGNTLIVFCQDWYQPAVDYYGAELTQDRIYLNDGEESREQTADVLLNYDQVIVVAGSECQRGDDGVPSTRIASENLQEVVEFGTLELYVYRKGVVTN